jgi:hypothetical protein
MTNLDKEVKKSDTADRELSINELDSAAGGCPGWYGPLLVTIVRALLRF